MVSTLKKRMILLLFTLVFSVGSYTAVQRYLQQDRPTVYPAVSTVQLQKQASTVKSQIEKIQSILPEALKAKTATDHQYSSLNEEKNTLTKKEQSIQRSHASN